MNTIPTKINRYNVYNKGNRLLGVGEEMTLPDFEPSSETVTGAGILGEIDDPTVGYFSNQELEIPFRLLEGNRRHDGHDQGRAAGDPRRTADHQHRGRY